MRLRSAVLGVLCTIGLQAGATGDLEPGIIALGRGDYQQALEIFTPLAQVGDQSAQSFLAHTYTLLEDYERAYAWYFASAECGSADAEVDLAILSRKVDEEQIARGTSLGRSYFDLYCVTK